MFTFLNQWIQNITFYLIIITLLLQMVPDKSYRKYIQFITGLILILLLIEPMLNVDEFQVSLENYEEQLQEFKEELHALGKMENE